MPELADIFVRYGADYQKQYANTMLPSHRKVLAAVINCRTETLGGSLYACEHCEVKHFSYHSCNNRHCPKCQQERGQQWLRKQCGHLLRCGYFLVTFTLPQPLRYWARGHQRLFYQQLFQCGAESMKKLALDPKYLGGQLGMIGVLHTWKRNLDYHPHVHFLVPAVGMCNGHCKKMKENFFLPVKALSKIYRAKFKHALSTQTFFDKIDPKTWSCDWVVHSKSVGQGHSALKYLAPYVFTVALSNKRILSDKKDQITFQYKEGQTGLIKYRTLNALKFMQTFFEHVLPKGFHKVRAYGFLHASNQNAYRKVFSAMLTNPIAKEETLASKAPLQCPSCRQPLTFITELPRQRAPPS